MREFYSEVAFKVDDLRHRFESLTPEQQLHMAELEDLLTEGKQALAALTPEESADAWSTAHVTGDPLIDKWEREIAAGLTPDLDESLNG